MIDYKLTMWDGKVMQNAGKTAFFVIKEKGGHLGDIIVRNWFCPTGTCEHDPKWNQTT